MITREKKTVLQTIKQLKYTNEKERTRVLNANVFDIDMTNEGGHTYNKTKNIQTIRMIHTNKENERGIVFEFVLLFGN